MKTASKWILAATMLACGFATQASAAATISTEAKAAIGAALDDEYRAEAFYAAVIAKFGEVRPFSNIIRAEQTHAAELDAVMQTYGMDKGTNPYLNDPKTVASVPATLAEACAMGVQAELLNRDLYDKQLMPAVAGYADIQTVFAALRDASENKHLPAFERCGGGGGQGMGQGHGMGQGMGHGKNAMKP